MAIGTTGCFRWEPVPLAPAPFESGEYRLTLRNGSRVDLFDPRVEADSIVGTLPTEQPDGSWTRALALTDVRLIETPEVDTPPAVRWKTVFDGAPAPTEIRLNLRDGSAMRLHDPEFLGDSIVGTIGTTNQSYRADPVGAAVTARTAIPRVHVAEVEAKKVNWAFVGPAIGIVAGIVAGAIVAVIWCEYGSCPNLSEYD